MPDSHSPSAPQPAGSTHPTATAARTLTAARTFDLDAIAAGLPAAALIDDLAEAAVGAFPRIVVEAPPGTGKTTIVPPLIAEHIAEHIAGALARRGQDGRGQDSRRTDSPTSRASHLGRVIVTQPRRMAARAAARRLAGLTGTRLGEVVGFTVKGESRTSAATRVEFVTTGVLLNRLLRDPELDGVSAVILDEVHERQLDTDLTFALCRELIDLRDDLSLVVMSATLDAAIWARRLGAGPGAEATQLSIAAEVHPLDVRWAPPQKRSLDARGVTWDFLDHMARTTVEALDRQASGDVLVFAPGAREVDEVAARITRLLPGSGSGGAEVHTLTGRTPAKEQDAILRPHVSGERRVIVSTSVAESALTVPGVRIVIDSGLSRGPRLDTRRRMSGLVTTRESKASGTQRAGRASRLGPGTVYRCLSEADWASLPEHTAAEVATSDLTSAVLALAVWGGDPGLLPDPMPEGPKQLALDNLVALGAVEVPDPAVELGTSGGEGGGGGTGGGGGRGPEQITVTDLGRAIARIPASVWSARGLFDGAAMLSPGAAAEAIAVIESDQRAPGADLVATLRNLRRSNDRRFTQDVRRFAGLAAEFSGSGRSGQRSSLSPDDLGLVVALSYPLQIARLRSSSASEYLLASGTAASLPRDSSLQGSPWLAISEVGLAGGRGVIRAAVAIEEDTAELAGAGLLATEETATFDQGKVRAVRRSRLGGIELSATPIRASVELARSAIAASVRERGAREVLRPSESFEELRARLGLLHAVFGSPWPDVRWSRLSQSLTDWCPAALDRIAKGSDPGKVDLVSALRTLLPWPQAGRLDELVPASIEVPSGSRIRLDYPDPDLLETDSLETDSSEMDQSETCNSETTSSEADSSKTDRPVPDKTRAAEMQGPVLAVKLQECFGWQSVPAVCEGRVPVVVHLLSPARRPLAVTSDLASFWANAYSQVRAENRGRYPKHPWPEDPLTAPAMRGTKRSGTMKR
ncbi:ATP-dependent helicase C-terminal domain-containing protein [Brevibacterium sp. ZH18]|uniref:ATP-dependent RNA helicase n=1 Tax=Brevibacterium sp. ZH18 TaxID=2927784 RepID=UPI001F612A2D|nr:ATP-dependent helicase C-terminal domain-containing protein [Brevibacterium sp. ZH18]MCI4010613.1 DEAD/DEAH box helicase [Brevibacterium sp. ZH18]